MVSFGVRRTPVKAVSKTLALAPSEACNCIPSASIVRSRLQNRYIRYVQSLLRANKAIFAIPVGVKQLPYKQGVKSLKLVVVG